MLYTYVDKKGEKYYNCWGRGEKQDYFHIKKKKKIKLVLFVITQTTFIYTSENDTFVDKRKEKSQTN